jgi:hypothetical protein
VDPDFRSGFKFRSGDHKLGILTDPDPPQGLPLFPIMEMELFFIKKMPHKGSVVRPELETAPEEPQLLVFENWNKNRNAIK